MSLEHIVVPESKEVHTKKKTRKGKKRTPRWGYIKGAQEPTERTTNGQKWKHLNNKIK